LADDNQIISRIRPNPSLGLSDYSIVSFVLDISATHSCEQNHSAAVECKYNWYKANYDAIAQCIGDINWDAFVCYNPGALSSWYVFVQVLWSAIDSYVPKFGGGIKNKGRHYPKEIRKLHGCQETTVVEPL